MALSPSDRLAKRSRLPTRACASFPSNVQAVTPAVFAGSDILRMALLLCLGPSERQKGLVKPLKHGLVLGIDDRHDGILRANSDSDAPSGKPAQTRPPISLQRRLQKLDDVEEFRELGFDS